MPYSRIGIKMRTECDTVSFSFSELRPTSRHSATSTSVEVPLPFLFLPRAVARGYRLSPTGVGSEDRLAYARAHQYSNHPLSGRLNHPLQAWLNCAGAQLNQRLWRWLNHLAKRGGVCTIMRSMQLLSPHPWAPDGRPGRQPGIRTTYISEPRRMSRWQNA